MGKSLKFAAAMAACASLWATSGVAQGGAGTANTFGSASAVMQSVSAADVAAMMTEMGISTQLVRADGVAEPIMLAETRGGARFLFYFISCKTPAQAAGCDGAVVSTAVPSAGLSYEALNAFNGEASVTVAVNVPGEKMVMFGRNIIVAGGHGRELFQATVYLFLTDVSAFVKKNSGVASVSFAQPPAAGSKIAPAASHRSVRAFGLDDLSSLVAAAIANTGVADFAADDPRGATPSR